jgi:hypothetical protein
VSSIGGTIPSKIASAPFFAALLSLIIGVIVLAIIYLLTYHRLMRKKKIHHTRHVKKTWIKLFAIMFVVVLIYAYITYVFASSANLSLPISSFINVVHSSSNVTILINQTVSSNPSISTCVSSLKSALLSMNKHVNTITETGFVCNVASSSSLVSSDCINKMLSSGVPIIFIDGSNVNELAYKGLFGNILYASGSSVQGSSCPLSNIFK